MTMAGAVLEAQATDEQLVATTRRGDDRAFEELYARYQRRVTVYVVGMVKDHGRAEDITQEIFVSALRRMRATERPIAFKPWIYEIARNACIDSFRRTRRTEEVSFDADEGAIAREAGLVSNETPDAAMHAKQQIDDLMGAFGGLSDSHHDILVMRELEGLSYREIGERLGLSRPSVESTLFRARKRLSEEYDELVSGERCLRVGELLTSDTESLGARDKRRLARHVAHCQPCRRQAYAAGVDTATLTRRRRRDVARRIAALFPVPAFLRVSHAVGPAAEPAAGWGKALAAAAVIAAAGGAGVAAQDDAAPGVGGTDSRSAPAPAVVDTAPVARRHQRGLPEPFSRPAAAKAGVTRASVRTHRTRRSGSRGAVSALPRSAKPAAPAAPSVPAAPADVATPPSSGSVRPSGPTADAPSGPAETQQAARKVPVVPEVVRTVNNVATQANGQVGGALAEATNRLGLAG